jgi:4-hydroxy-tetrahydrodipicolinate reductase
MTKIRKWKFGLLGSSGRMGSEVLRALAQPRFSGRLEPAPSFESADLWLEFSTPAATLALVRDGMAKKNLRPFVVGSTGWRPEELAELEAAAHQFPILRASNFSLGIQICKMTLDLWRTYPELGAWKVSIFDLHHGGKKDSPSGTALSLREALGRDVEITSIREGEAIGTHEIRFESDSEKLTLIHEAKSRAVFAEGALEALLRLANRDPASLPKRLLGLEDLYLRSDA